MACIDEQQPNFKHYCRVCKKGFMCGRALGGHMRAHGIGDETNNLDDDDDEDDPVSDWEENNGGGNKKMYQLRTNPNRLKTCRACEHCGKEFVSWKSFLEHGKCSSDESFVSSTESEGEDDDDGTVGGGTRGGSRWSKRKRSVRSKVGCSVSSSYPPTEEDDILLARCLVQLANTVVDLPPAKPEESCASASREEERRNTISYFRRTVALDHKAKGVSAPKGMFECKACKKVFNSHQALGGHRASHKKVKGCYAAKQDQDENNSAPAIEDADAMITNNNDEFLIPQSKPTSSHFRFEQGGHALVGAARRKAKVHECSICHRVFTSGQALGGHKRCHWSTTSNSPETSSLPKLHFQNNHTKEPNNHKQTTIASDNLDLNVPAWVHVSGFTRDPPENLTLDAGLNCLSKEFQLKKADDSNNVKNESVDKTRYLEDEAGSKLNKLSNLKEMDNCGASSQWLQVGIGSTSKAAAAAADDDDDDDDDV